MKKKVKVFYSMKQRVKPVQIFDAHTPDTYKAVYAVEPVSGHPAYRVSRNITVKRAGNRSTDKEFF